MSLQVRPQVVQHGIVGRKLTVEMQQLAAGVAQEQPAGHAVVRRGEVQEKNQGSPTNQGCVLAEQNRFVRRQEAQLAGKLPGKKKHGKNRQEGRVRDHRRPSSNA